jgi:hypothetical protein
MAPGGVCAVIQEILDVPTHDQQGILRMEQKGQKYNHSRFHMANMLKNIKFVGIDQ